MFYTYAHSKPEGKIFYIGKGQGKRACDKTSRNPHWHNIVNKYGFNAQVLAEWETEKEALEHEVFLIACFKDMGYELANITAGGEDNPMNNAETRQKVSKAMTGKKHSKETLKKMSGLNHHMFGKKHKEESKLKTRNALIGGKNHKAKKIKFNGIVFDCIKDLAKYQNKKYTTTVLHVKTNPELYGYEVLS